MSLHTLYLSSSGLLAVKRQGQELAITGSFEPFTLTDSDGDERSATSFLQWLGQFDSDRFQIIVDAVEEEHTLEDLPALSMRDRTSLVKKRLLQKYRDQPYRTWRHFADLGEKPTGINALVNKRRTSVRLSALRSDAVLHPWITLLERHGAKVACLQSASLLAEAALKKINIKPAEATGLMVSLQPGGLRQTLLVDGKLRFSRLAKFSVEPDLQSLAVELNRTVQYLNMSQILTREKMEVNFQMWLFDAGLQDIPAIRTLVVHHVSSESLHWITNEDIGAFKAVLPDRSRIAGIAVWARFANVSAVSSGYQSPTLFVYRRADVLRRRLWTFAFGSTVALLASAAALEWARSNVGLDSSTLNSLKQQSQLLQTELDAVQAKYSLVGNELWLITQAASALQERQVPAQTQFTVVAAALEQHPEIVLTSMKWIRGVDSKKQDLAQTSAGSINTKTVATATASATATPSSLMVAGNTGMQKGSLQSQQNAQVLREHLVPIVTLEVHGSIATALPRVSANALALAFSRALAKGCNCSANVVQYPYDIAATTALSGSFGISRTEKIVPLTIHLTRPNAAASSALGSLQGVNP